VTPADISLVINTHLHFDHAGGNTRTGEDGSLEITFPNATYIVRRGEYDYAMNSNERTAASYFERNYVPLEAADKLELIAREKMIVKGIRVIPTPGHTPYHQSILIESAGERAFFLGDLVPTHAHLPLPWIMGYDVEPLVTLETKRRILKQALDESGYSSSSTTLPCLGEGSSMMARLTGCLANWPRKNFKSTENCLLPAARYTLPATSSLRRDSSAWRVGRGKRRSYRHAPTRFVRRLHLAPGSVSAGSGYRAVLSCG